MLTGAPVFTYRLDNQKLTTDFLWDKMDEARLLDFLVLVGTSGDNHEKNACGIAEKHSFSVITSFYLRDPEGNIMHKMHMIRNPRKESGYSMKWNHNDLYSWKPEYREQVPFGIDPLSNTKGQTEIEGRTSATDAGIFFVDHEHF